MGAGRTELAMSMFGRSYGRHITGTAYKHGKEIDISSIDKAISKIDSCISCFPQAEYEFSYVLDLVRNVGVNEEQYFLADPVYCPHCSSQIKETTLVQISDS